jgi:hypothetical protein
LSLILPGVMGFLCFQLAPSGYLLISITLLASPLARKGLSIAINIFYKAIRCSYEHMFLILLYSLHLHDIAIFVNINHGFLQAPRSGSSTGVDRLGREPLLDASSARTEEPRIALCRLTSGLAEPARRDCSGVSGVFSRERKWYPGYRSVGV